MNKLTTLCICAFLGFSIISEKASAQCTPYIFAIPQTTNCNSNTINFNVYCTTIFDLNTGVLPAGWDCSPFVIGSPCVNTPDNSPYFWTTTPGTNDTRHVVTNSVDASAGGYIVFDMRYGAYDDVPGCGFSSWPDGEVYFQYSNNNGAWVNIAHWVPNIWDWEDPIHAWNTYVIGIPLGAFGPNTHFRWFQPDNAGADYDNWGLDDIYIVAALGGNVSYLWDFGDGTTSTAVSELHTYTNSGQYTVTLTITYSPNNVVTLSKTLNICVSMSGTYTIGGSSSDFVDIASAVSQLQTCCISGPVVFNIASGTYTEQISIGQIPYVSSINTITFQSASGDNTDVVIQYSSSYNGNWVVKLDGAEYISFKNLTIKATGNPYASVVHLTNGAEHNVFENNIIQSIVSSEPSARPLVLDAGALNQYNTFENNVIEGGRVGIYCRGTSSSFAQSNVFKGNEIKDFYHYGAYFQFQNSLQFDDNIVDNQVGSNYVYGTYFYYCDNIHAVGNKVNIHGTTSHFGIWLSGCDATSANPGLIANNFVSLTGIGTATWHGLDVHNSDHLNVYYNSVNLIGGSTISRALYQEGLNQNYKNNIFSNSGGGYSAYFSTPNAIVSSDYNDYFTTGTNLAYWNGNRANLADLQTASGKDAHSISVDPTFISDTDLHTSNAFIDNAGNPVAGIIDDIDGETRDITTPDIGADEHMVAVDAGPDETTYFGSPGDQTVVHTAIVSRGTPPYSYSWTLDRPLICNQVNADGDEQFFGGTCTNNICPTTGSPTETALCSGSDAITAVLLDTASICVTVTDANGSTATDCFTINASDARCFAGNSGAQKVKICHQTGNPNNPWVEICVDTSAIDAHLAHGDSIGSCDNLKMSGIEVHEEEFTLDLRIFPNPTSGLVTLEFNSIDEQSYFIDLVDRTGRKLATYKGKAIHGLNSRQLSLAGLEPGIYLFKLNLDDKQEVKKLLRE